ncbi:hypothetical protein LLG96_00110 [bacterium]|nr:hypothetical protein [bacterium]
MKRAYSACCLVICGITIIVSTVSAAVGSTTVAPWKDNKKGAYSMGFDDSMQSHRDYCIPNLIQRGLVASFWVNPATTRYGYGIDTWESLASRTGMELCDHSMDHNGANFMEEADYEIGETARIIRSLNPPGSSDLVLFNRGGGTSWPKGYEYIIGKHGLVDGRGGGIQYRGPDNADSLIAHARRAIEEGTWTAMYTHGTGPYLEWLGFEPSHFEAFLDYLASVKDKLWTGTYGDVHKYEQERISARVAVIEASNSLIRLELASDADPDRYDFPLTLLTEVPKNWKFCHVNQGDLESIVPVTAGMAQYGAVPGRGEIRLTSTAMDTTPPGKPIVRDGTGADLAYTPHTTRLAANWDRCLDPESGIARYWYRIGITPGGAEIIDWIDNGRSTSVTVTRTNLSLTRGVTYYVTVKAVNGVGLTSVGTSDGQTVEMKPDYVSFAENFESGSAAAWKEDSRNGRNTLSVLRNAAHGGTYGIACHVEDTNGISLRKNDVTTLDDTYVRFYFRLSRNFVLPDNRTVHIMRLTNSVDFLVADVFLSSGNGGPYVYVVCNDNKRRNFTLPCPSSYIPGLAHVSPDSWHCIDIRCKADAGNGGFELWVDGDRKMSFLHRFTNGWELRNMTVGVISSSGGVSGSIYFDDITVSDSYPGAPQLTTAR